MDANNVEYKIDPRIVRGLDYYTKTVFEFVSENIGAQGTVCGGGRYDGLIGQLGGSDVPGIGFATGIERLLMVMENSNVQVENQNTVTVYFAPMGEKEAQKCFELCNTLRQNGLVTDTDYMGKSIKAQFKYADKIGAKYVAVIGSSELETGSVKIKRMADGVETLVTFDGILEFLKGEGL